MKIRETIDQPGVAAALAAALLFGIGTPLAKRLLEGVGPWMLAGLLYLGSGIGLALLRRLRRAPRVELPQGQGVWLAGAVLSGGVVGPVLLMLGLSRLPASGASLLLNAEGVFTALLAWFAFRENFDRRIALGMLCIVIGALVLSWPGEASFGDAWPALLVLGACLAWAVDNNLTRKVSLNDAMWIASVKGLAAGVVNLSLAFAMGAALPSAALVAGAMTLGFLAYGLSLALFVVSLRHLGTARTGAYFSVAPFFGALVAVAMLGEAVDARLLAAGLLMGIGVWLHLSEDHAHAHVHEAMEHEHAHEHDAHHQHPHPPGIEEGARHSHWHRHEPLEHAHPHFPDAHHRHPH
ncbi:DMT family transporter [Variovorax sp. dw_308]|uniref:DMT family transporter n=1 Tax=Variovorax sp. dw_308 TaxID=2721546 RepID=UPI001C494668|nr:DMT family transporter [Variovorax sp. dw_308]